jgi:hypothetical protein
VKTVTSLAPGQTDLCIIFEFQIPSFSVGY